MNCPQCDHSSTLGALLCEACGAPLLGLPSAPSPTPPSYAAPAPHASAPPSYAAPAPHASAPPSYAAPASSAHSLSASPHASAPPPYPTPAPRPGTLSPSGQMVSGSPARLRFHKVINGERQREGFNAPISGRSMVLGRHDLERGLVVEVDLRGFLTPPPSSGYPISRRQARLSRDLSGLWLEHLGRAETLWRAEVSDGFVPIPQGQRQRLRAGDHVYFGTTEAGIMFVLDATTP